jgi:hypothetical protein
MRYQYQQVQGGYRWNMLQRCLNEVGVEPIGSGDIQIDGNMVTYLEFSRDLTDTEKTALDTLMASNPTLPPTGTARVKIKDIYERLPDFIAASGLNIKLYYSESTLGSGKVDTIELHTASPLTSTQKNKIQTAFAGLLTIL